MGAADAAVKIIGEVAWPLVVCFTVFVLRTPLSKLLDRMKNVRVLGNSGAEFAQHVAEVKELAEAVLPSPPVDVFIEDTHHEVLDFHSLTSQDEIMGLINLSPVAAISVAWTVVEKAMRQGADPAERFPLIRNAEKLIDRGLLAPGVREVIARLSNLRGQAVHAQITPDADTARDFVDAAWRVASAIDAAHGMAKIVPAQNKPNS